ncbi:MAG: hypothetical protein PVF70_05825 [Anaerolineales bacterium]
MDHPVEGPSTVLHPEVFWERCIGYGYYEHKCPVKGGAAIRVQNPESI